LATVEQESLDRLATARLVAPSETEAGVVVDLLFASSGIEREVVQAAERLEVLPELSVPVAQTGHLIALKLLSRDDDTRPQDLVDLRALLAEAHEGDLELARQAVGQVADRGFHRGRDLARLLRELIRP
jgi:predicted nucleotidyltransferase